MMVMLIYDYHPMSRQRDNTHTHANNIYRQWTQKEDNMRGVNFDMFNS